MTGSFAGLAGLAGLADWVIALDAAPACIKRGVVARAIDELIAEILAGAGMAIIGG